MAIAYRLRREIDPLLNIVKPPKCHLGKLRASPRLAHYAAASLGKRDCADEDYAERA